MASILVIDDDEQVQAGLRGILEEAGYRVVVASNGQQGLQQFRREPADLVLLDIFMPELDGLETLAELYREYPAAKVIAISDGGKEPDFSYFECARMLGTHSALPKPLDREQLLLAVGHMLRGVSSDTDSSSCDSPS
jgi:CheY-like chemotaxis protein